MNWKDAVPVYLASSFWKKLEIFLSEKQFNFIQTNMHMLFSMSPTVRTHVNICLTLSRSGIFLLKKKQKQKTSNYNKKAPNIAWTAETTAGSYSGAHHSPECSQLHFLMSFLCTYTFLERWSRQTIAKVSYPVNSVTLIVLSHKIIFSLSTNN